MSFNKRLLIWPLLLVIVAAVWFTLKRYERNADTVAPRQAMQDAMFRLQVAASNRVEPKMPTPDNPLVEVDLKGIHLSEALMQDLSMLPSLRTLNLGVTDVKDADLKYVQKLVNLETLYLGSKQITDKGVASLLPLKRLKLLDLGDTSITDAALPLLKNLPELEQLYLANTSVTDAGLEHLKSLPKLSVVFLDNTPITAVGLSKLEAALPKLQIFGNPRQP